MEKKWNRGNPIAWGVRPHTHCRCSRTLDLLVREEHTREDHTLPVIHIIMRRLWGSPENSQLHHGTLNMSVSQVTGRFVDHFRLEVSGSRGYGNPFTGEDAVAYEDLCPTVREAGKVNFWQDEKRNIIFIKTRVMKENVPNATMSESVDCGCCGK